MINVLRSLLPQKNSSAATQQTSTQPITAETRLKNLMTLACKLNCLEVDPDALSPVFMFVKLLCDAIMAQCITEFGMRGEYPLRGWQQLFVDISPALDQKHNLSKRIWDDLHGYALCRPLNIRLGKDPLLCFPWDTDRLKKSMDRIGGKDNPWHEQHDNHRAQLLLPMGVTSIYNGNHSSFSGYCKQEGELLIAAGSYHSVLNFEPLYQYLEFDGINYIYTPTCEVVGCAKCFEFGCLFELGRVLTADRKAVFRCVSITREEGRVPAQRQLDDPRLTPYINRYHEDIKINDPISHILKIPIPLLSHPETGRLETVRCSRICEEMSNLHLTHFLEDLVHDVVLFFNGDWATVGTLYKIDLPSETMDACQHAMQTIQRTFQVDCKLFFCTVKREHLLEACIIVAIDRVQPENIERFEQLSYPTHRLQNGNEPFAEWYRRGWTIAPFPDDMATLKFDLLKIFT